MNSVPKISIITPSLNQGKFIERTIQSVLQQGYPNLEYIVVDGGSNDATLDILKKYSDKLIWVSEKDKGQADAINKGIERSSGEIIAYLNSDDMYDKEALLRVSEVFQIEPSVMWVTGRCRIIDENNQEIRKTITAVKNFLLDHLTYNLLLVINPISQPATFWRRNIIEEIGLFNRNEHLVMDYEYSMRVCKKYNPAIINDYLACFRIHRRSKTTVGQFSNYKQELTVSKRYSNSKLLYALHYLNYVGIYTVYSLIDLLGKMRDKK
jgi:glycosyltransferase involved in cell wall biosynthesis